MLKLWAVRSMASAGLLIRIAIAQRILLLAGLFEGGHGESFRAGSASRFRSLEKFGSAAQESHRCQLLRPEPTLSVAWFRHPWDDLLFGST